MPKLTVIQGADTGFTYSLDKEQEVVICGRQDGAALQLTDTLVSSQHFRIVKRGASLTLGDLGSRNGVMVNGEKVKTAKLAVGDVITVGESRIEVQPASEEVAARLDGAPSFKAFELQDYLGAGAMGVVYKAKQVSLERIVALKVLPQKMTSDPAFVKKFIQEARAAGSLTHANVVQVHDVGEENGLYYICMEFVPGGTLGQLLKTEGKLDIKTAVRIATDMARGLEFAESKGIVHCDIKPDNVMLTTTGDAKIADLGIALRSSSPQAKQAKEVLGSPHYMAPEQAQGKPMDHRVDIYALGCTLFRMLAGRTLFAGATSREVMKKQVSEQPPALSQFCPDAPPSLTATINKMLAKDPARRFQSAGDIVRVLSTLTFDAPAKQAAPPQPKKTKPSARLSAPSSQSSTAKKKPVALRDAPSRREGSSTNRVKRSRSSQSSSIPFLPIGIGVVLLAIGIAVMYGKVAPDPAVPAYAEAVELYNTGQFQAAYMKLKMGGTSRDAVIAKKAYNLRILIEQALRDQDVDAQWQQRWQEYQMMVEAGASTEDKLAKLNQLREIYMRYPEKLSQIHLEISRVNSEY